MIRLHDFELRCLRVYQLNKILPLAVRRDWRSEVINHLIVWFEGDDQSSAGHKGGKGQRLSLTWLLHDCLCNEWTIMLPRPEPVAWGRKHWVSLWKTSSCFLHPALQHITIFNFKLQFRLQPLLMASAAEHTKQTHAFISSLKDRPNSRRACRHPDWFISLVTDSLWLGRRLFFTVFLHIRPLHTGCHPQLRRFISLKISESESMWFEFPTYTKK